MTVSDPIAIADQIIATRHAPLWEAMLQRMATHYLDFDPTSDEGIRSGIEQARLWHRDMLRLHSQMARVLDEALASIPDR